MPALLPLHEYLPRRIALIKPSALGDIVHALPVLSALRDRFPKVHIAWVINRAYEPLLRDHPELNETLVFDRGAARLGWLAGVRALGSLARTLRQGEFDLAIDLQGLLRSGLMCWATGARRRVGLAGAREGAGWFYTDRVALPQPGAFHAVDRYGCVAQALGASGPKRFVVPIATEANAWTDTVLGSLPRPWVLLGVGARWLTKRWLPAHFAELARRAQAEFGGSVLFIGAADETHLAGEVARQLTGPRLDLTGRTTLPQLVALLARADVLVANDTGPLHLAVALGRPVVAPYTCTRVAWTGPYGQAERAVATTVWCAGSCRKRCARMECMAELTPDRLWPVVREVLETWLYRSQSA